MGRTPTTDHREESGLRITDVETFIVDGHRMNWVIVKIGTDAGIAGIGDATVERREAAVVGVVEALRGYLIGKDPFPVAHHADQITRDSYWRTGVINRSALSGVEAALLDIKGKALGVPVYELLGGKCRDRVPAYANNWAPRQAIPGSDSTFEAAIERPVSLGFKAVKWDPFGHAWLQMPKSARNAALTEIRLARRVVGDDVDLLIEGHGRLDVPTAVIMGHAMAEFEPLFFEEPIPPDSVDALAEVRNRIPVPLAAGERYVERHRFLELIERHAADWLQPDVCHVGGLFELQAIAAAAQAAFLPVAPHNPMGPVGNAMTLHLAAALPNFAYLETMMVDVPWRGQVVREEVQLIDGEMTIPDRPGLGVEFDEAAAARHPFQRREPAHFRAREPWPEGTGPWYGTG